MLICLETKMSHEPDYINFIELPILSPGLLAPVKAFYSQVLADPTRTGAKITAILPIAALAPVLMPIRRIRAMLRFRFSTRMIWNGNGRKYLLLAESSHGKYFPSPAAVVFTLRTWQAMSLRCGLKSEQQCLLKQHLVSCEGTHEPKRA